MITWDYTDEKSAIDKISIDYVQEDEFRPEESYCEEKLNVTSRYEADGQMYITFKTNQWTLNIDNAITEFQKIIDDFSKRVN